MTFSNPVKACFLRKLLFQFKHARQKVKQYIFQYRYINPGYEYLTFYILLDIGANKQI